MIYQLFTLFVAIQAVLSASTGSTDTISNGEFTNDLFSNILKHKENSKSNLIFSPASIHTCLSLAYFGAEDKTASEMVNALHFTSPNKDVVAKQFENLLKIARGPQSLIKLANKIYANKQFEIKPEFNEIAKKSFESEAETLDLSNSVESVKKINDWVAEHTNNKIQNLVDENIVNGETKMILINAIHFKGNWKTPLYARDGEFYNDGVTVKNTKLMFVEGDYLYSELNDLNALAVKMPYANSELSMMFILPKDKTGLNELENKLKGINLLELADKMKVNDVAITLPKFQIESKLELNDILSDMGMRTMFTDDAKFDFFKTPGTSKIGKVLHKAFIDVNESGTEAAGSTGLSIVPTSLNLNQKYFYANYPFFFAIMDKSNIYFTGHLINV